MYAQIENDAIVRYPVSLSQVLTSNPNVSLSSAPAVEDLAMLGYAVVAETERPAGDVVTEGQPEQRDGVWYQTWEVREFTAEEIEEQRKAQIPASVTMRQARLAMLGAGILDDVEAAIAAMEGDEGRAARIDWEYALDVRRDWPLINALGSQLGLTEQQIDDLFVAAAAVPQLWTGSRTHSKLSCYPTAKHGAFWRLFRIWTPTTDRLRFRLDSSPISPRSLAGR